MTASRVEPDFGHDRHNSDPNAANGLKPDLSRVLIVGNSQINRIVVSKIVERSGLKPICEAPPGALRVLPLIFPALVILDGGPENRDCDSVVAGVLALRRVSGNNRPSVILLSTHARLPPNSSLAGITDVVVTKPFTTEQLQPVVDKLIKVATI